MTADLNYVYTVQLIVQIFDFDKSFLFKRDSIDIRYYDNYDVEPECCDDITWYVNYFFIN